MGHIEPAHGSTPQPPERPGWVTALKILGYTILTLVVLVVVLAGVLLAMCGAFSRR